MNKLAFASAIISVVTFAGASAPAWATEIDYNAPVSCQFELDRLDGQLRTSLQYHNLGEATNYYNQAKAALQAGDQTACHAAVNAGELDMVRNRHGYRSGKFD